MGAPGSPRISRERREDGTNSATLRFEGACKTNHEYDSYDFPIEEHIEECKAAHSHQSQARTDHRPPQTTLAVAQKLPAPPFCASAAAAAKAWPGSAEDFDACGKMARTAGEGRLKRMWWGVRRAAAAGVAPGGRVGKRSGRWTTATTRGCSSVDQQERRERELLAIRRSTAAAGAEIRSS